MANTTVNGTGFIENKNDQNKLTTNDQFIVTLVIIIAIVLYPCFYIWKWTCEYCRNRRNRYRLAPGNVPTEPPMEMRPSSSQEGDIIPPIQIRLPSYEDATGIPASAGIIPANDVWPASFYEDAGIISAIPVSSDLAARQIGSEDPGQDNPAYVNDDILNVVTPECSDGTDGNNTNNSGARRKSDTDVVHYIGELSSNVLFCSRNRRDSKSNVDSSSVESNNGTDTVDDGSDSKYETASSGSTGGRNSRAPSLT